MVRPAGLDLGVLAERMTYVGSTEHKIQPSFAGQPTPRADASKCDRSITREQAQAWLREAMREGSCGEYWEGDFPRYLWLSAGGQRYEARLVNRVLGQYKGYPIEKDEWPEEVVP